MKKVIKIILITITSIVLLGTIFAVVDYIRAKNGENPIFIYRSNNINSEGYFIATEYYGLGYKIVVCDRCIDENVIFMPLYFGAYAWFIGMPVDKLNGRWFHANNNDIYLSFDGVGYYTLSVDNKVTEKGTYALDDDSVILTPSKGDDVGNCTIKNNYHELHCDKYAEIFMQ
jgi:hypothetical protein